MTASERIVTIVLAESSLELVPREIASHPSIRKWASVRGKNPAETLLDTSLHYFAMKKLRDREKRGRPDIVHVSLLEALSSPLNIEGRLRFVVHTVGDYAIFVDPSTRIPRNYLRFVGLMEQVLKYGKAPPESEKPLLRAVAIDFPRLLRELGAREVVLLDEGGTREKPREICRKSLEISAPIVIGGFPRGDFSPTIRSYARHVYSIYPKPLDTWVVVSRVVSGCEELVGLL
ncbi:MAG: 16S rRNA methyltransferase [Sulfolobales archaeon]|nr:16S rRNA methyltransferase [Sulfolobales archaeon]MCX8208058.1 16S rRNA methyltransferase [Sulfolobales archaeon]MDW8010368.1 16S rRNA methyltransferase [Sulfolobales archaeon]